MVKKDTMKNGLGPISEVSEITDSTSTRRSSGSFGDRFVGGLKNTSGSWLQHAKDEAKKSLDTAKHIMKKESNEGGGNYGSLNSTEREGSNVGFQFVQRPKKAADSWFRRDFSFKATFTPNGRGEGTERRRGIIERLLGPTDRDFSDMVNEKGGLGLDYQSVDRGIFDTAVWHRRKVSLIQDKAGKSGVDRRSSMLNANIFQDDGGYVYDHEAVKRLDRERGRLEYALVVVTGFVMAVIGIAVSHTADNILEMKLDSALEVRERKISSYDRAFVVS